MRRFVEKPAPGETESRTINAGTYVFEESVLDRIPSGRRVSVERETFPALVADGALAAVATDHDWIDTGRPELYLAANLAHLDDPIAETARVASTARITSAVIGADAVVGDDAVITESVILPGAEIGAGARLERSLVWGRVPGRAVLVDCVVGRGAEVPAGEHRGRRFPEPS